MAAIICYSQKLIRNRKEPQHYTNEQDYGNINSYLTESTEPKPSSEPTTTNKINFQHFTEPEGLLPCSQEPYPE
jgi:hypothetical protein